MTLSPDPAYEADTLTCTPGDITDADGTAGFDTTYAWGQWNRHRRISTTLNGDHFDQGDEVVYRTPVMETTKAMQWLRTLSPSATPHTSINTVSISPTNPIVSDTLTCSYGKLHDVDGDNDSSTYSWTVDGAEVGTTAHVVDGIHAADANDLCGDPER